jgi:hypothetical protein
MIIYKDVNENGEFTLSIAKNGKSEKIELGIFSELSRLNNGYEMVKATLRATGKKISVVDNI